MGTEFGWHRTLGQKNPGLSAKHRSLPRVDSRYGVWRWSDLLAKGMRSLYQKQTQNFRELRNREDSKIGYRQ